MNSQQSVIAAVLVSALAVTSVRAETSASVKTRIGDLTFERGFPTEETKRKVFDELDYQRAVQAYLWAYPAVSFEAIRIANKRDLGVDYNDLIIADNYADPKGLWLTANDTTIYAMANVELGKSGPMILEMPPGAIVGIIEDFWQRSISDVGLPGPDAGKGGKFLILPPGYKGEVPKTGYFVLRGTMNNYNIMVRGILVNNDKEGAVQNTKRVKVYPYSERNNPQAEQIRIDVGKGRRIRFRPRDSRTGRLFRRSSITTPFRIATCFSWACSSRWELRKASHLC